MAHQRSAGLFLLFLACTSLALQAAAMPMHPDLLTFAKLPIVADPSEELEQTAARKLQQQQGPLFLAGGGPFTFDGFGGGFTGLFPGGGFFNGFAVNLYNILFRNILNEGLNQYLANGLTNNPFNPIDFVPPSIGNLFNRNVVALFGFDAVDKFVGQYLKRANAKLGSIVEAGCTGPTYSLTVDGGSCKVADDGSVTCEPSSITYSSTPYICNLPYRSKASLKGQSYKYNVAFGRERSGEVGLPAGVYNFGAAVNVTTPYLGLSLATSRLANDLGLQQWYQFVGNLILNELLRLQAGLLSGAVDARILTVGRRSALPAGGNAIAEGADAIRDATGALFDKIAGYMGIKRNDLEAGLKAAGAMPTIPGTPPGPGSTPASAPAPAPTPKQQQQMQATAAQKQNKGAAAGPVTVVPNMDVAPGDKTSVSSVTEKKGDQAALQTAPAVRKAEGPQVAPAPAPAAAAKKTPKRL